MSNHAKKKPTRAAFDKLFNQNCAGSDKFQASLTVQFMDAMHFVRAGDIEVLEWFIAAVQKRPNKAALNKSVSALLCAKTMSGAKYDSKVHTFALIPGKAFKYKKRLNAKTPFVEYGAIGHPITKKDEEPTFKAVVQRYTRTWKSIDTLIEDWDNLDPQIAAFNQHMSDAMEAYVEESDA